MEQDHVIIVVDGPVPKSIERALKTPAPNVVLAQKCYGDRKKFREGKLDTLGKNVKPIPRSPTSRVRCISNGSILRESRKLLAKVEATKTAQKKEEKKL